MPKAFKTKGNLIGQKIRQRRIEIGLSQEGLSERLDVSYQQIQKYEKGVNQLNIGRLQEMAHCLRVPIDYFLKDLPIVEESPMPYNMLSAEEKRLVEQFRVISGRSVKLAFLRLMQAISQTNEEKTTKK